MWHKSIDAFQNIANDSSGIFIFFLCVRILTYAQIHIKCNSVEKCKYCILEVAYSRSSKGILYKVIIVFVWYLFMNSMIYKYRFLTWQCLNRIWYEVYSVKKDLLYRFIWSTINSFIFFPLTFTVDLRFIVFVVFRVTFILLCKCFEKLDSRIHFPLNFLDLTLK